MKISWFDSPTEIDAAVANAERARDAGLHRYWVNQTSNADPMVTLGIVGREVADIELGTSVVAMQTTFANTLASQSRTINQATGGRFTLGLGASHKPAMEMQYGIEWRKPYTPWSVSRCACPADRPEGVDHGRVRHHAQPHSGAGPDSRAHACGAGSQDVGAGERAHLGTITWMTGPKTIESFVGPAMKGGEIVAGVPVWITDDVLARAATAQMLQIYGQLPSYEQCSTGKWRP